jgi:hypothetical protein
MALAETMPTMNATGQTFNCTTFRLLKSWRADLTAKQVC